MGDVFSHLNFLGSWVDDVNTLCWCLPGSVCSSSHQEPDPVKEKESGVSELVPVLLHNANRTHLNLYITNSHENTQH